MGRGTDPDTARAHIPLADEVAEILRERIHTHRYATGTWLRQETLSAELGVSRTPLREALRILEREGLVQIVAGKGARVVTGDVDTLLDAYQLRAVVDGLAARLAAERSSAEPVRDLRRTIDVQRAALDPWSPRDYTQSNVDFHEEIIHLAGNEFVLNQLTILRVTAQVFAPVALIGPDSALRAVAEHTAITDAIEAGDGPEAERVARAHIDTTIRRLEETVSAAASADPS
ncbi:DNA-binding transcriptional regulator, GntR family [Prauserella aidingensis]|uniref:GntR family transcriptional regulator n=1 Tax=Prauserella aidingensis TaxID=387890 RepID=UPI0020A6198F|nr:GntR family transcriptional regulator [Prauserella aidingensis]MCP2252737.1 DNA-binding transcriptional regulator, GntR family [Prauserella aidingensis]